MRESERSCKNMEQETENFYKNMGQKRGLII